MVKKSCRKQTNASNQVQNSDSEGEPDETCKNKLTNILDKYASEILGESTKEKEPQTPQQKEDDKTSDSPTIENEQKPKKEVEVVVFQSRKRKKPVEESVKETRPVIENKVQKSKYTNERLDSADVLKKLQFDIGTFGMRAFSKEEQREQEKKRAIKLGAKAPRRQYINYKMLMEDRKKQKGEASENSSKVAGFSANSNASSKNIGKPKFWKEGNKTFSPQIGKYRDGVLKLSRKDIKSVTKRK